MATSGMSPDNVYDLGDRLARLPSKAGGEPIRDGRRWRERNELRRTAGGGGRERAELLDDVHEEVVVATTAHLPFLVNGVGDLLTAATQRDMELNALSLTVLVRGIVESTGRIDWLLDPSISATDRCRRLLVWRFESLRSDWLILDGFSTVNDAQLELAMAELEHTESNLVDRTTHAGWQARSRNAQQQRPAGLLREEDDKHESMPNLSKLAGRIAPNRPFLYQMLSGAAHGSRLAVRSSIKPAGEKGVTLVGSDIDIDLLLILIVTCVGRIIETFEDWDLVDTSKVRSVLRRMAAPRRLAN